MAALALVVGGLYTALVWHRQCPIEVKVAAVEPSGTLDDAGAEMLMVTLSVSNRDCVAVMFEPCEGFEAQSVGNCVPFKYAFTVPRIAPGEEKSVRLLAPPATFICRLHLHYQTQIWKCRLMEHLGLRGRTLVAKSRLLCKLVWPDELKPWPEPPRWKQATLEAAIPANAISASPIVAPREYNWTFFYHGTRYGLQQFGPVAIYPRNTLFIWRSTAHRLPVTVPGFIMIPCGALGVLAALWCAYLAALRKSNLTNA